MAGGRLTADPLFQGLARPVLVLGVSYMYFLLNAMICMVMFINTKSFAALPLALVIHGFGYLLCMKEPRAIELWMLRMKWGLRSWNRAYHSFTNSYDVF
jgi:type IV secretion system protein VirB3